VSTEVSHFGEGIGFPTFGKLYQSQWDKFFGFPEHNTGLVMRDTHCVPGLFQAV